MSWLTSRPNVALVLGCVLAVLLLMASAQTACAQSLPNAGSTLRETQPLPRQPAPPPVTPDVPSPALASPPPAGPAFLLRSVRFKGASVYAESELRQLVADRLGKPATLADLETIARQLTERYRSAGYILAAAIVPAQDVTDGNVEISVLEGLVGAVKLDVDPAAPIDPARVRAISARLMPGRPLRQDDLVRTMLLLSDLPGISVQAELESGDAAGTSDVAISVRPTRRWDVSFDADNHGSRSVAEYRAGMQARLNSPLGIGDNLDLRLQLGTGGGLTYGRLGYERPVGVDGQRLTLAYSRLRYALGQDFAVLGAAGNADVVDLSWAYPFIRSRSLNLLGSSVLQYKKLQDRIGEFSLVNDKHIGSLSVGLSCESNDRLLGGGYSNAALTILAGNLALDSQRQRDDDDQALRSRGRFAHANYSATRLNTLTPTVNLFLGVVGQFASTNLDSAEKLALGGPHGVRAYAPSEATSDEAHVVTGELRYSVTADASLQAFYDAGWARINRNPLANGVENNVHRSGYGVGVFWARSGFTLRASLAWRDTGPGTADSSDRSPRLYAQISNSL